ncbi:MAG TPA: NlpC/P60 family protein [Rhodopila sp.]|nr:NlpC/P60 family protein [Rhodopila sp.]
MNIANLIGLPWKHGETDCYALLRAFYKQAYNVELTDYPRPDFWWVKNPQLDLIRNHFRDEGFTPIHVAPRDLQVGDVLLMAIGGTIINHCAVYVGNGFLLHHVFRTESGTDRYAGIWRDRTVIVARHPLAVNSIEDTPSLDLIDLLPEPKRSRYRAILASRTP